MQIEMLLIQALDKRSSAVITASRGKAQTNYDRVGKTTQIIYVIHVA